MKPWAYRTRFIRKNRLKVFGPQQITDWNIGNLHQGPITPKQWKGFCWEVGEVLEHPMFAGLTSASTRSTLTIARGDAEMELTRGPGSGRITWGRTLHLAPLALFILAADAFGWRSRLLYVSPLVVYDVAHAIEEVKGTPLRWRLQSSTPCGHEPVWWALGGRYG